MWRGLCLLLMGTPAFAGDLPIRADVPSALEVLEAARSIRPEDIQVIDAKNLSVEDLIALAVKERANPTRLQCCDWGGSCLPHAPGS